MRVLSLGAGVQSSAVALMAAIGELPPLDHAVFADTQNEPKSVYTWLEWLEQEIARSPLPFPVHKVTRGNLAEQAVIVRTSKKSGSKYLKHSIPVFTATGNIWGGQDLGKFKRHCTSDFKISVIYPEIKRLCKPAKGEKVSQVFGISFDEVERMSMSQKSWVVHEYPLVDRRLTRLHCIEWMESHGYPKPPRSACVLCPFHSDKEWNRLKTEEPEEFARAVEFEKSYQQAFANVPALTSVPYLHASLKPINEVDFSVDESQADLFINECKGMCGV